MYNYGVGFINKKYSNSTTPTNYESQIKEETSKPLITKWDIMKTLCILEYTEHDKW